MGIYYRFSDESNCSSVEADFTESFKVNVNFFNFKHLDISYDFRMKSQSLLLQILKKAPQDFSLKISMHTLMTIFNNPELCEYLNKMV
jgi:hypothetical protein